jgi:predicted AAA+ superfamily ATPase
MKSEIRKTLIQKLNDALVAEIPGLTRREIRLPDVPSKAFAVIGMRRSGKTFFLSQCMPDLLAEGMPRESLLMQFYATRFLAEHQFNPTPIKITNNLC